MAQSAEIFRQHDVSVIPVHVDIEERRFVVRHGKCSRAGRYQFADNADTGRLSRRKLEEPDGRVPVERFAVGYVINPLRRQRPMSELPGIFELGNRSFRVSISKISSLKEINDLAEMT
jgi:hypothetical protein